MHHIYSFEQTPKVRKKENQTNVQADKQTKTQADKDANRQRHKQTKPQANKGANRQRHYTHYKIRKKRGEKIGKTVWKKTQS